MQQKVSAHFTKFCTEVMNSENSVNCRLCQKTVTKRQIATLKIAFSAYLE